MTKKEEEHLGEFNTIDPLPEENPPNTIFREGDFPPDAPDYQFREEFGQHMPVELKDTESELDDITHGFAFYNPGDQKRRAREGFRWARKDEKPGRSQILRLELTTRQLKFLRQRVEDATAGLDEYRSERYADYDEVYKVSARQEYSPETQHVVRICATLDSAYEAKHALLAGDLESDEYDYSPYNYWEVNIEPVEFDSG